MKIFHVTERSYYYNDANSTLINEFYDYDWVPAVLMFRELCENNLKRGCVLIKPASGELAEMCFRKSLDCFPEHKVEVLFHNVHECIYAVTLEAVKVPNAFVLDDEEGTPVKKDEDGNA